MNIKINDAKNFKIKIFSNGKNVQGDKFNLKKDKRKIKEEK